MLEKIKFKIETVLPKSRKVERILKVTICFAIAFALTITLLLSFRNQNSLIEIIKPAHFIPEGTKITEKDLKVIEVGKYGLPENIIKDKSNIIGKYTATDIYDSDFIIKEKLSKEVDRPFFNLQDGEKVMSFTVPNLAASVASNIQVGDRIQVYYSEKYQNEMGVDGAINIYASENLRGLKVIDIKDADGYTKIEEKQNSKNSNNGNSFISYIPSVITVIVNEEQAKELYKAEITNSIYAAFLER